MNRALHIINSLDPDHGGTSVSVPALVLATAATNRYSNLLLQLDRKGPGPTGLLGPNAVGYTTDHSILRLLSNRLIGGSLDDAIRWSDVVQIHGIWQRHCIATGLLAGHHRKPMMVSAHGMLETWALRNKSWKKWPYSLLVERPNLRRAAVLRALTQAEAGDYRRFGLVNPVAIIPNGVDAAGEASPKVFFEAWPELKDRRIVLYLSRIHYKKGVDLLVKAWAQVAARFPDAHLVIAGPDFEGTQAIIEQLIRDLSIESRITFTGAVYGDLKASLLHAASVFILPSHSEGFSVAVLESLAAGVPVVITKGCNFPDVGINDAGWVISPVIGEISIALSEALESSKSDLQTRGQNGLRLVQSKYSWPKIGEQMADVYDWMLGGPRPTSVEIVE
jgi:glycosyltransferase involved in cell wall biosynthesis